MADLLAEFNTIEEAIQAMAAGKIIIVTDDEDRENEGDLVMSAAKATAETVNIMIRHARGLICVPTTGHQLQRLGINQMVQENRESHRTDFSISVDAAQGISTGISAYDRCRTIQLLANPETKPEELVQPGHVFPLRAKPGGVLQRAGHTEAAVDLALLAGLHPSAVICEVLNDDGTMARLPELVEMKHRFGFPLVSIAALIEYRHRREKLVRKLSETDFPTEYGLFRLHVFESVLDERKHLALTMGMLDGEPTLVRVHGGNLLGDVFHSIETATHRSLQKSLRLIASQRHGVLLYMQRLLRTAPPGSPDQPAPPPTVEAMSFREYGIGAQILVELGLSKIRLLSGTQRRVVGLDAYGLEIVEQIALSG